MLRKSDSNNRQKVEQKPNEEILLWWFAAGVSVSIIWLPIINAILCISFVLFWFYYSRFNFRVTHLPLFLLFISFYVLTLLSFFYSDNGPQALSTLQLKLPLLLFPLVFSSGVNWKKGQIQLLLLLFSWSVGIFCILTIGNAVLQTLSSGNFQDLFGYRIIPFDYVYASVASVFCVFGAVIHLNEMAEKKQFFSGHLLFLLLFWTTLILLSNRMGIFLCLIVTLFFLVRFVQSVRLKLATVAFIILIITGLYSWNKTFNNKIQSIAQSKSENLIQLDQDASLGRTWDGWQLRLAIWNCAASVIKANFWTGVGVGNVQQALQKAYEDRKFYFASRHNSYNAHNQFIEQWLMTGLVGCILYLVSLGVPFFQSLKSGKLLYTLFLAVCIFFSFTESLLEISKGVVWFSFFNSIFAFQASND